MKKLKYLMLFALLTTHSKIFAATDSGILGGVDAETLRRGDIHTSDVPKIIVYAIDFLMGIAGTISIIFIIIGAYQIALGSLENDKSKGKGTIKMALAGFILASLSWIIMKVIISNFT